MLKCALDDFGHANSSCDLKNGASDRLGKVCINEHVFGIEITVPRLIDYAQLPMLLSFRIGNDDVDLASFK